MRHALEPGSVVDIRVAEGGGIMMMGTSPIDAVVSDIMEHPLAIILNTVKRSQAIPQRARFGGGGVKMYKNFAVDKQGHELCTVFLASGLILGMLRQSVWDLVSPLKKRRGGVAMLASVLLELLASFRPYRTGPCEEGTAHHGHESDNIDYNQQSKHVRSLQYSCQIEYRG